MNVLLVSNPKIAGGGCRLVMLFVTAQQPGNDYLIQSEDVLSPIGPDFI